MTETTKTVLKSHQIRKSRKQKTAFIHYVTSVAEGEGYTCHTEKGHFGARNIVVGNPETAKVVYTAHYDTCARLPFPNFITPTSFGIYLLYQLAVAVVLFGVPLILSTGLSALLAGLSVDADLTYRICYNTCLLLLLAELWLIMAGPANRHTANDNTSGVTTLLDIMQALPQDLRGEVAFIFFDLEEMGLFGSAGYASKHKRVAKQTLLLNFDCVSDGQTILFVVRKAAVPHIPALRSAFPDTETLHVEILSKGVFYPSDQANFARGVGVASLKKSRRGLLYMDRIHTRHDTVYKEENISYLSSGAVRLAQELAQRSPADRNSQ